MVDTEFDFQRNRTLRQRKEESTRIMREHPDRLPIVAERYKRLSRYNIDIPDLDKTKFLIPYDLNIGQLIYVIRKRIKLSPEKGMFVFINGNLPATSELISNVYNEHKNEDGFLYVHYTGENVFG